MKTKSRKSTAKENKRSRTGFLLPSPKLLVLDEMNLDVFARCTLRKSSVVVTFATGKAVPQTVDGSDVFFALEEVTGFLRDALQCLAARNCRQ